MLQRDLVVRMMMLLTVMSTFTLLGVAGNIYVIYNLVGKSKKKRKLQVRRIYSVAQTANSLYSKLIVDCQATQKFYLNNSIR